MTNEEPARIGRMVPDSVWGEYKANSYRFIGREDLALAIVRDLAAQLDPLDGESGECLFCSGEWNSDERYDHAPECPYRRAIELMGPNDA